MIQLVSEAGGEIVCTVRIGGREFTPPIFEPGSYTLHVGEPGTDRMKVLLGLEASPGGSPSSPWSSEP